MLRDRALILLLLLLTTPGWSQDRTGDTEPPVAGRVEPFSGAVGRKLSVAMLADRTELQAGDTLQLTVRVVAEGPWQRPPQRPDLRRHEKYARFPRLFHIENAGERHDPDGSTWEFLYRLRPLSESVAEVPRLSIVYYKPGQGYQTTSAPPVKLTVRPRAEVSPAQVQGVADPPSAPERLYHLVEGPGVLREDTASALPSPLFLILMLLIPPVACACWYGVWRWQYPEAARLARQRQSRAAQTALHVLGRLRSDFPTSPERQRGGASSLALGASQEVLRQVAAVLVDYLRQRFGLPGAEPTPGEVANHLDRAGVPVGEVCEVTQLLRDCDAARFAAQPPAAPTDWPRRATSLILALEAAPCPSSVS